VADNTWKAGEAELNNTEDSFIKDGGVSVDQRKMNAVRAYFEWMPIRQVEMDDNLRIWRNFEIGDLMDLIMVSNPICRLLYSQGFLGITSFESCY
jgi:alkaline phosphatase D